MCVERSFVRADDVQNETYRDDGTEWLLQILTSVRGAFATVPILPAAIISHAATSRCRA